MNRKSIISMTRIVAVLILTAILVFVVVMVKLTRAVKQSTGITPSSALTLLTDGESLLKTTNNRSNVLLLGIGGGEHEGPDLTDTIIIASLDTKTSKLSLISVPRDIWSDTLKDRINSAYHYGEMKKKGGGITFAKAIIEDVVGIPIHYTAIVNFFQFQTFIDHIGGIDIVVPKGFEDTEYPIAGKEQDECDGDPEYRCRYETLEFMKGLQHMDGKRALQYVRSRHAEGRDGNDFSRGERQQDVILAVKEKMFSMDIWKNPTLAMSLYQTLEKTMTTDMVITELIAYAKLSSRTEAGHIQNISLEPFLMIAPLWQYDRYALIPIDGFDAIHQYLQKELAKQKE